MIRVVIADDHTIVREGLKQVLAADAQLQIVGEAGNGHEVMQRVRELDADVLLLDMSMPGKSGIDLIKQVRAEKPKTRVLVLSMHHEQQYAVRAIRAGASGYLTKDSASTQLLTALHKVANGGMFITSEVGEQLAMGATPDAEAAPHKTLSDREFQVFGLLVAGTGVTDIGEKLNLSVKTVSTHKANILKKLNVDSTAELVRYAIRHRLSDDPQAAQP